MKIKSAFAAACFLVFTCCLFLSCNLGFYWFVFGEDVEDRAKEIVSIDSPDSVSETTGEKYSVLVVTDLHFGSERTDRDDEAFYEWFKKQLASDDESLKPRFMICLGDILDGGHKEEAEEYNNFADKLAELAEEAGIHGFTSYSIVGNHDLYNHGWSVWKENIYPHTSFYVFNTKSDSQSQGMSWYFLDTGNGTLGKTQLDSLCEAMKNDSRPKIVSMHYPLYCGGIVQLCIQNSMERNILMSLFAENNVKIVLEGHAHRTKHYDCGNFEEHLISSYLYSRAFTLLTVDEKSGSVVSHPDLEY
ncbi:MAG: metallophosphoesterase [Treponema sp.]|nr:metallophosphoesterase [Treponema sp.]